MKLPVIYFTGFNGFGQFNGCDDNFVSSFKEWNNTLYLHHKAEQIKSFKLHCCWAYNAVAINNVLYLTGLINGEFNQIKEFKFETIIKEIACNDTVCLILLENSVLYKLSINRNYELKQLNFISVEIPKIGRNSIFGNTSDYKKPKPEEEVIQLIACGHTFSVGITNRNAVYNIPSKIHSFPQHVKIIKVCGGAEHALLLTSNGDVYTWGASSRGQLGLGRLDAEETPVLIEALAGIKITDISAGGWHSAAVSSFGDLYMWGWNVNGQMGHSVYEPVKVTYERGTTEMVRHKMPSVFALPEIVNLPIQEDLEESTSADENLEKQYNIVKVFCGMRHTIAITSNGQLLGSGWNSYGQLGMEDVENDVVRFSILDNSIRTWKKVVCGSWCTVLLT